MRPSLQEAELGLVPSEQGWEKSEPAEAAERGQGIGGPRPDAGEHLCPRTNPQHLDHNGVSGSHRTALPLSDWPAFSPRLGTHCSASQTPTLFQHVLCCPFNPEVFPGKRPAHCAPDLPSRSPPRLPPVSSHQQIQLTNLMLQLQKAKQLWKTDQVPWNSLSQGALGSLEADSGVGREEEQDGQTFANPGCARDPPGKL